MRSICCFVALSLVGSTAFGSSICFFDTCYVDLPGYAVETNKEIICGDTNDNNLLYNKCIISCNKPNVCSKIIKCPYNGIHCAINCKSEESCSDAIILAQNTKYTQLNLQTNNNHSLIIEPNNNNGTLIINNKIINTQNKCDNVLIDTSDNNVNIECYSYNNNNDIDNNRQLLMYNNTNMTLATDDAHIIELNEAEINKTSQKKQSVLLIVILLLVVVLLCCSFYLLLICICPNFKHDIQRYFPRNNPMDIQQEDDEEDEDEEKEEEEEEDTLSFYGNGGIELQIPENDTYLDMMNDMLSVKSISVIST